MEGTYNTIKTAKYKLELNSHLLPTISYTTSFLPAYNLLTSLHPQVVAAILIS